MRVKMKSIRGFTESTTDTRSETDAQVQRIREING